MANKSKHVFSLKSHEPFHASDLGSLTKVTKDELPILKNLSIKRLVIAPGAIREPHWHVNANELSYCLEGTALVSILDTGNSFHNFTISAGQMFHIPSGSLHHIENIGTVPAEFIIGFSHENPEDFSLHGSFGAMSDAVLGNTYDVDASAFSKIRRDTSSKFLVARVGEPEIPSTAGLPDQHKYNVEEEAASKYVQGIGSAKQAKAKFWPDLKNISMYSLVVEEEGMREPHWHPRTCEMGYVHKGSARMSIMDPDGSVDTYILNEGDMYFIPAAYPHQIEVIGSKDIHFLIFFDQPLPEDVGYRTATTALSRGVLASTFGVTVEELPVFPFVTNDPLLVKVINPVDPVV